MATNTTPFNHQYYNNNQYPSISYYSNDANKTDDCTFAPPIISSYSDGFEQLTNASIACEQKHQPEYNRSGIHETSNLTTTDLSPLENLNWDHTNTASCSILNSSNQQQSNNSSTIDYLTHTEQFYQYDNRHDCSGYATFTDNNVVF